MGIQEIMISINKHVLIFLVDCKCITAFLMDFRHGVSDDAMKTRRHSHINTSMICTFDL